MKLPTILLLLLPAAVAACSERPAAELPPEVRAERRTAERNACISVVLAEQAESDLATLDTMAAHAENTPALTSIHAASRAYAEAFLRHAQLRESAYLYADSALNFAATPTDSMRYAKHSASFVISVPEPGSVERNVFNEYQAKFGAQLADPSQPCNWEDQG